MDAYVLSRSGSFVYAESPLFEFEDQAIVAGPFDSLIAQAVRDLLDVLSIPAPLPVRWRRYWALNGALALLDSNEDAGLIDVLLAVRDGWRSSENPSPQLFSVVVDDGVPLVRLSCELSDVERESAVLRDCPYPLALAVRELLGFVAEDAPAYSYISWRRHLALDVAIRSLDPSGDELLVSLLVSLRDLVDRDSFPRPVESE